MSSNLFSPINSRSHPRSENSKNGSGDTNYKNPMVAMQQLQEKGNDDENECSDNLLAGGDSQLSLLHAYLPDIYQSSIANSTGSTRLQTQTGVSNDRSIIFGTGYESESEAESLFHCDDTESIITSPQPRTTVPVPIIMELENVNDDCSTVERENIHSEDGNKRDLVRPIVGRCSSLAYPNSNTNINIKTMLDSTILSNYVGGDESDVDNLKDGTVKGYSNIGDKKDENGITWNECVNAKNDTEHQVDNETLLTFPSITRADSGSMTLLGTGYLPCSLKTNDILPVVVRTPNRNLNNDQLLCRDTGENKEDEVGDEMGNNNRSEDGSIWGVNNDALLSPLSIMSPTVTQSTAKKEKKVTALSWYGYTDESYSPPSILSVSNMSGLAGTLRTVLSDDFNGGFSIISATTLSLEPDNSAEVRVVPVINNVASTLSFNYPTTTAASSSSSSSSPCSSYSFHHSSQSSSSNIEVVKRARLTLTLDINIDDIKENSTNVTTCFHQEVNLVHTVVKPPCLRANTGKLTWRYGGSSRMLRICNGGEASFIVRPMLRPDGFGENEGGDDENWKRFTLRDSKGEEEVLVLRPGERGGIWVKCAPSATRARATLVLSTKTISPGVMTVDGETTMTSNDMVMAGIDSFPMDSLVGPRDFEVELNAGGDDDVICGSSLEQTTVTGIMPERDGKKETATFVDLEASFSPPSSGNDIEIGVGGG